MPERQKHTGPRLAGMHLAGCTPGRGPQPSAPPTGAWIISGGCHTGVMKQVGEAVRDFSLSSSYNKAEVVTIGIATWGTVHNRDGLVHPTVSCVARAGEAGSEQVTRGVLRGRQWAPGSVPNGGKGLAGQGRSTAGLRSPRHRSW